MRYRYVPKECVLFFSSSSNGRNITKTVLFRPHFGSSFQAAVLRYRGDYISASLADHIDIDAFEVEIRRFLGGTQSRAVQRSVKEQCNGVLLRHCDNLFVFCRHSAPIRYVTKKKMIDFVFQGSANRGPLLRYCSANSPAVVRYDDEGSNKVRYSRKHSVARGDISSA